MPEAGEPSACPKCSTPAPQSISLSSVHSKLSFYHYDWGKKDRLINYPDGHSKIEPYNERYE